jgi:hypothetical protein
MRLIETDSSLSKTCRAIEKRTQEIADTASLELPVVLLPNFDSIPNATAAARRSPCASQVSENRIIVNAFLFFDLEDDVAEAALVHEAAHGLCHRDKIVKRGLVHGIPMIASEEIVADLFVCQWGFFEGLRKERLQSYGSRYCEILEAWPNEEAFVREMIMLCQQRLANAGRA